jgi:hypothetical protein
VVCQVYNHHKYTALRVTLGIPLVERCLEDQWELLSHEHSRLSASVA